MALNTRVEILILMSQPENANPENPVNDLLTECSDFLLNNDKEVKLCMIKLNHDHIRTISSN